MLLHTKYIWFQSSREEDFKSFSHNKSIEAIDPQGVACFDPRGLIGRIYVGAY